MPEVQIGLNCEPPWLCNTVMAFIGLAVVVLLLLLLKNMIREWRKIKQGNDKDAR